MCLVVDRKMCLKNKYYVIEDPARLEILAIAYYFMILKALLHLPGVALSFDEPLTEPSTCMQVVCIKRASFQS